MTTYTVETARLRAQGFRCRRETISGQGYYGGDGCVCYRVRDAAGYLAIYRVSTYQAAYRAWAEVGRAQVARASGHRRKS